MCQQRFRLPSARRAVSRAAAPPVRFVAYTTLSRLLADQRDDENASVMHLGSGAFTISVKRVGDCSL